MTDARRLVTYADIVEHSSPPGSVGVVARHELEDRTLTSDCSLTMLQCGCQQS